MALYRMNRFKKSLRNCELGSFIEDGLDGIQKSHRGKFKQRKRKVLLSINAEDALRQSNPAVYGNVNHWDYLCGIGKGGRVDARIGVEAHRATTEEVDKLVAKKKWFSGYLARKVSNFEVSKWFWVALGGIKIAPTTIEARRLSQEAIILVPHVKC